MIIATDTSPDRRGVLWILIGIAVCAIAAILLHRMIDIALVGKDRAARVAAPAAGTVLDNAYFGSRRIVKSCVGATLVSVRDGSDFGVT